MNSSLTEVLAADSPPVVARAQAKSQQTAEVPPLKYFFMLLGWLKNGWNDLRGMPLISLGLGSAVAMFAIGGRQFVESNPQTLLPMLFSAIALSPFLFFLFCSLSHARQNGGQPSLGAALADVRPNSLALGTLALLLTLVAIAGLRLIAIAVALSLDPSTSANFLESPTFVGFATPLAVMFGATGIATALLAITLVGVPAIHGHCLTNLNTTLPRLRRNQRAILMWLFFVFAFGATAIWVTPWLLIVGAPVLAYANQHMFRSIVAGSSPQRT